ncbi:MAG TPA: 16S rRNA (uracil(1498)-N(3))-methyltransferase, partial [Casimicrobiaceae bacterium]|nr:16S rRNA (uracil(1498)-N(3))-methyltransferase [Casimicrobiaceae bacterium]
LAVAAPLRPGDTLELPPEQSRHVAQALRMRVGDALTLFTGPGGEYEATIERIERRDVVVRIEHHVAIERESTFPVTLVQAVIAGDMMDFVVRKAVELGVAAVVPVQAARSQGVPATRAARRAAHWRQIAIAACEQSGRNRIPQVHDVVSLTQWLTSSDAPALSVILDASASASLVSVAANAMPNWLMSGPEGGFTAEEVQAAVARGFVAAHLGPRVLRAETAPLAALATLNALAEK